MAQAVSSVKSTAAWQPSVGTSVSAWVFLKPDQPVQGGRHADRAAGVRAQGRPGGACGHASPRRRRWTRQECAARRPVPVCRCDVGRRAMVRIDADAGEGELGQVGVADQRRAGGAQALPPPGCRRAAGACVGQSTSMPARGGLRRPRRTGLSCDTASPASAGTGAARGTRRVHRHGRGPRHGVERGRHEGMSAGWRVTGGNDAARSMSSARGVNRAARPPARHGCRHQVAGQAWRARISPVCLMRSLRRLNRSS